MPNYHDDTIQDRGWMNSKSTDQDYKPAQTGVDNMRSRDFKLNSVVKTLSRVVNWTVRLTGWNAISWRELREREIEKPKPRNRDGGAKESGRTSSVLLGGSAETPLLKTLFDMLCLRYLLGVIIHVSSNTWLYLLESSVFKDPIRHIETYLWLTLRLAHDPSWLQIKLLFAIWGAWDWCSSQGTWQGLNLFR